MSGIPFGRLAFAGTFLLAAVGLSRGVATPPARGGVYQLVLHADLQDHREYHDDAEWIYHYGSQWDGGPVLLDHDASDGKPVEFTRRWPFVDGCLWESTERLQPISAMQYRYFYTDRIVSCERAEGEQGTGWTSTPTPRSGIVDLVPVSTNSDR
jgi:hypothetical protein